MIGRIVRRMRTLMNRGQVNESLRAGRLASPALIAALLGIFATPAPCWLR